MSQGLRFSLLALGLSIVAPLACGVTESSTGSNTNWFSSCSDDDDCSNGYSCLCGVCTSACELEADDDCQATGAQCTELAAVGCKPHDDHESACLPSCAEDADCDSFGDNLACEASVCIAETGLDEPPQPTDDSKPPELEPQSGSGWIALGSDSPCVTRDGKVWCWGQNQAGQAAQPPGEFTMPITEIEGLEGIAQVVAGSQHKCALTEAGRVYCWGLNDRGQVGPESAPRETCSVIVPDHGLQDIPCQPTPTLVPDLPTVVGLTLNDTTTCAWFEAGDFTCWGESSYLESAEEALSDGVSSLALGYDILCAVASDQSLWCSDDDAPQFDSLSEIALAPAFDGGPTFGCALGADGDVDCWGRDDSGQRGLSSFGSPEPAASDEPAIREDALEVHVGQNHACALLVNGTVSCWGRNDYGETGSPPNVSPRCAGMACQPSPTPVLGLPPAVDLASRDGTTCALSKDAELYCWGSSDVGSPWRMPGPWEGDANECDGIDQAITDEILTARLHSDSTTCETESDCVEVDLGVSCQWGCQSAPMHKNNASAMRTELTRIDASYCPAAEQQDCAFRGPECPPRKGELACVEGACVRFDADTTGCENACACKVLQEIAYDPPGTEQDCYALKLQRFVSCSTCDGAGLYFAVSNTGQQAFAGEVTVELWSEPDEVALREPVTFELSLGPGEHSEPLYIESDGASGLGMARLVAPDSCDFMSEWTDVPFDMPAPVTCSE